jgi:hypothetical protein
MDQGSLVWLNDFATDVLAGGLDVLAVGVARVHVSDARAARLTPGLLMLGAPKNAVRDGRAVLVRVVLDRPPEEVAGRHAAVLLATDIDGLPTDDAPTTVSRPDGAFAGLQDVYSFHVGEGAPQPELRDSDLRRGWYKDRDPFAVHRPAGQILDFLVRPRALGDEIRVVTYVADGAGGEGAYDVVRLGGSVGDLPLDGLVDRTPACLAGRIVDEPITIERVVQNRQAFDDLEVPWSWQGGGSLPLSAEEEVTLTALIEAGDVDGDGRHVLPADLGLLDDGLPIEETVGVDLWLEPGRAYLRFPIGLTRRGYHVLTGFAFRPTGDPTADGLLASLGSSLASHLPPFSTVRRGGIILGDPDAPCLPDDVPRGPAEA